MTKKQFNTLLLIIWIVVFLILACTLRIFSVYLFGGPIGEPVTVGDGMYRMTAQQALREDLEIPNQTLLQVVYRLATDGDREKAERVSRIGVSL